MRLYEEKQYKLLKFFKILKITSRRKYKTATDEHPSRIRIRLTRPHILEVTSSKKGRGYEKNKNSNSMLMCR